MLSIILARTLSPDSFGIYVALISFAATMIIIANFGIDESLNRFIAPLDSNSRKSSTKFLFLIRMLFLSSICLLLFIFNNQINGFLGIQNESLLFEIIILYIYAQSMTNFFINYHTAELRTRSIFFINVGVKFLVILSILIVLAHNTKVVYLLAIISFFSLVSFLLYLIINKDIFGHPLNSTNYKSVLNFSAIIWLNALLTMVLGRYSDILLINYFIKETKWSGFYEIAFSICIVLEYFFTIGFMGLGLSMLSKASSESLNSLNKLRIKLIKYHQLSVLPAGVFLFIFANEIVPFVFSAKYNEAIPLLKIYLVFTIFVVSLLGSGSNVGALFSIGKQKFPFFTRLILGISNLVINIFVVQKFGVYGIIWVTGIAYLLTYTVDFFFASKFLGFDYDVVFLFKTALVVTIASGITYGLSYYLNLNILLNAFFMAIFVLAGYYLLKLDVAFNEQFRNLVFNLINRNKK